MSDTRRTAVALRYDPSHEGDAPRVTAKGSGSVADEILRLAKQHDVPLRPDPGLADALAQLELGTPIPPELFRAVAEVLAFVYQMNASAAGGKTNR